jgi:hypothetical protein
VLVELAIYLQAELALHQRLPTQAEQAVAVAVISLLAVTLQVTQAVLAEMVEVVAVALTTQAHLALAVTALFISTTKEKLWEHTQ